VEPAPDTTAPVVVTDNGLSVQFGATATITSGLLAATDPDNSGAQLTYTVENAPSYGTLLKSGAPTSWFTQADIDNGLISYQETATTPSLQDSFTFVVSDPAGNSTANTSFQIQSTQQFLLGLAKVDADVYNAAPSANNGWNPATNKSAGGPLTKTDGEFQAFAHANADQSQIVIAIRGTVNDSNNRFLEIKNLLNDIGTFPTGIVSTGISRMTADAANFLAIVHQQYPNAQITITGHSLGGAIAHLIGKASGYNTIAYNAPGAGALYNNLQKELAPALALGQRNQAPRSNINYHVVGDAISMFGTPIGDTSSIVPVNNKSPDNPIYFLDNHEFNSSVIPDLDPTKNGTGTQIKPGLVEGNPSVNIVSSILQGIATSTGFGRAVTSFSLLANAGLNTWYDPGLGSEFIFSESASSPLISSLTFVDDPDISAFKVWWDTGGQWSLPQTVTAGVAVSFGQGTSDR
jgi:VCBS repeat-containing protein